MYTCKNPSTLSTLPGNLYTYSVKYVFDGGPCLLQDDESKPEGDVGDGGAVCGSGQSPGSGLRLVPRLPHEVRLRDGQGNDTQRIVN